MRKQRTYRKTVSLRYKRPATEVPILVPSDPREYDALATFLVQGLGHVTIRVLGPGDFNKMAFRGLSKKAQSALRELIALRQGIIEQEEPSFWLRRFLKEKPDEERFGRKVTAMLRRDVQKVGQPSALTKRLVGEGQLPGDPLTFLSVAFSRKLSGARLVLWWKGPPRLLGRCGDDDLELRDRVAHILYWRNKEHYVPAIYCPEMETAFYVYALFKFTGGGFGICPQCGEVFQKVRPDSLYCCFSHGEAFRLRRWRADRKKKPGEG